MKNFGKALIVLFCLWHMAAITAYSLPDNAHGQLVSTFKSLVLPLARPYLWTTSQWQRWNMFSPDPLRRVTRYVIEQQDGVEWRQVKILSAWTLPWWQNADTLKILQNLQDGGQRTLPMRGEFLRGMCADLDMPAGANLRLVYASSVLPMPAVPLSQSQWAAWQDTIVSTPDVSVVCRGGSADDHPLVPTVIP